MKKVWKKTALAMMLSLMLSAVAFFTGCSENVPDIFGMFSQGGHYLTEFSVRVIASSDAIDKITAGELSVKNTASALSVVTGEPAPLDEEMVNAIVNKYSELRVIVKYYSEGIEEQQVTAPTILTGTSLTEHIRSNSLETSMGLKVSNLIIYKECIEFMEEANTRFQEDENSKSMPFNKPFSYGEDENGLLVVQMREFTEIPATTAFGGIDCNYREDTEMLYDSENKISKWQTSLGIQIASNNGTMTQGYIYEVEFEWIKKR